MGVSVGILVQGDTPWNVAWNNALSRLHGDSIQWNPLLDERLPRLVVVLCTGASLTVASCVMQSLFQNPLAAPSVLGISSGGSLGVLGVFILGWQMVHPALIPLAAIIGSLLALSAVYYLAYCLRQPLFDHLILTGIAMATVLLAVQHAILYAMRDHWQLIQTISEWEAGTTHDRTWQHAHMQLPLTIVGLWGCWHYRSEINLLSLGEEEAQSLGVDVKQVRWHLFLCISLLTGGSLAAMGIVPFFGLILPNILRHCLGPNCRVLIPCSLLGGSATLAGLDLTLRFLHIQALSIGHVSALFGGVFFLALLFRPRRTVQEAA